MAYVVDKETARNAHQIKRPQIIAGGWPPPAKTIVIESIKKAKNSTRQRSLKGNLTISLGGWPKLKTTTYDDTVIPITKGIIKELKHNHLTSIGQMSLFIEFVHI